MTEDFIMEWISKPENYEEYMITENGNNNPEDKYEINCVEVLKA